MTYKDFEYELVFHPHKVTSNDYLTTKKKKSGFKMTLNGPHFNQKKFGFAKMKKKFAIAKQTNKQNKQKWGRKKKNHFHIH
jgi:hypothetical protein